MKKNSVQSRQGHRADSGSGLLKTSELDAVPSKQTERCVKCKHSRHYFDEGSKRCAASWTDFPSCYCQCVFTTADPEKLIAAAPAMYEALKAVVCVADRKTVEFDIARAAIALANGVTSDESGE